MRDRNTAAIAKASEPSSRHVAKGLEIGLDDLNLTIGQTYPLDLFYAERLGATGDFAITTTLALKSALD